jgi:hypothetical protein
VRHEQRKKEWKENCVLEIKTPKKRRKKGKDG